MGTTGIQGVLNGLWISGLFFRRMRILMQTITKANKVPMDTSSLRIWIGKSPAKILAAIPVTMVVT